MRLTLPSVAAAALAVTLPLSAIAAAPAPSQPASSSASSREGKASTSSAAKKVRINVQQGMEDADDFIVGPARFLLELKPGQSQTVELQITNRMGERGTFELGSEDFDTDPDSNSPRFYTGGENGPYTGRRWLKPEVGSIELRHADRAFINVTVTVPDDAEPGDHQAAIVVKLRSPGDKASGINIVSRVATLFVITVPGKVVQDASIDSLQVRHRVNWNFPVYFRMSASNRGNIHVIPQGTVVIRNVFGVPVDEVKVSDWVILRDATRPYDFAWEPRFALGHYTAESNVKLYGKQAAPVSVSFWVLPMLPLLIILLAIFLVSFLVQYVFARFELKRKR